MRFSAIQTETSLYFSTHCSAVAHAMMMNYSKMFACENLATSTIRMFCLYACFFLVDSSNSRFYLRWWSSFRLHFAPLTRFLACSHVNSIDLRSLMVGLNPFGETNSFAKCNLSYDSFFLIQTQICSQFHHLWSIN